MRASSGSDGVEVPVTDGSELDCANENKIKFGSRVFFGYVRIEAVISLSCPIKIVPLLQKFYTAIP